MKIWSLPKHKNLTKVKIYCGKEKLLLRCNFPSFPQHFQYISNFKSEITYVFVKCGCSNYFYLNSAIRICRGTDISKYLRESIGIRDNESRLYFCLYVYYCNCAVVSCQSLFPISSSYGSSEHLCFVVMTFPDYPH